MPAFPDSNPKQPVLDSAAVGTWRSLVAYLNGVEGVSRAPEVLSLLAVLAFAACSSSPTDPGAPELSLQTAFGAVTVWSDGSDYDLGDLRAALERGQRRALAQRSDVASLSGLKVAIYRQQVWGGVDSVGAYDSNEDVVLILADVEEVAEHELQHRAAWKLGHRDECYRLQDHSPGFDLHCEARR